MIKQTRSVRTLSGLPKWQAYKALVRHEARALRMAMPAFVNDMLLMPLGYLLLLGGGIAGIASRAAGGGTEFLQNLAFILPGVVVLQAVGGLSSVMYRLQADRQWGLMAFKLVQGITPGVYLASIMTVPAIKFLGQALVLVGTATLLGVRYELDMYVLIALGGLMSVITWGSIGGIIVFTIRRGTNRMVTIQLLTLPLIFGAPTFYPFEALPAYMKTIAWVNPLTYQVEFIRRSSDALPNGLVVGVTLALLIVSLSFLSKLVETAELLPSRENV